MYFIMIRQSTKQNKLLPDPKIYTYKALDHVNKMAATKLALQWILNSNEDF
jgi:hypothetical protein